MERQTNTQKGKLRKQKKSSKNDPKTLFVGGFGSSTKHQMINDIFSKFGDIKKIKMIKNKKGGSRGYCFVIFEKEETVLKVLAEREIFCNSRELSCRPVMRGEQLQRFVKTIDDRRVTCFDIQQNLSETDKEALRFLLNQELGQIENFYFAQEISNKLSPSGTKEIHLSLFLTFKLVEDAKMAIRRNIDFRGKVLSFGKFVRKYQPGIDSLSENGASQHQKNKNSPQFLEQNNQLHSNFQMKRKDREKKKKSPKIPQQLTYLGQWEGRGRKLSSNSFKEKLALLEQTGQLLCAVQLCNTLLDHTEWNIRRNRHASPAIHGSTTTRPTNYEYATQGMKGNWNFNNVFQGYQAWGLTQQFYRRDRRAQLRTSQSAKGNWL